MINVKSIDPVAVIVSSVASFSICYVVNNYKIFVPMAWAGSAFIITIWELYFLCRNYDNKKLFNEIIQKRKLLIVGGLLVSLAYEISIILSPFGISLMP